MLHRIAVCVAFFSFAPCWAQDAKHTHTNRLAKESSPYLLQHAHNPVNWYPWGEEAFEKARRENKLVFLSVGYAACHWCHVMERESFMDAEIAKIMNERFVCVKVDREERPDVDQIYMTAVQLISRNGGWPMSVFLLPDARPFWGGTYFPARDGDRPGATGFLAVMNQIQSAWLNQKDAVNKQADALTSAIKLNHKFDPSASKKTPLQKSMVELVADGLGQQFDPVYGGFGYAEGIDRPKFPEPSNLVFLLDRVQRASVSEERRESAKKMLMKTLDGMTSGAMLDHLGGGFHRYSVDRRWQIPHFEKMLYDNGQLASVYAEAYQLTKSDEYKSVVEGICDFVIRELKSPEGGFFAALDADSEGEEGKFYRWTQEELKQIAETGGITETIAETAFQVYRLQGEPNFEGEYFVPDPRKSLTAAASDLGKTFTKLNEELAPLRQAMFSVRAKRERPITDIKVLTAWNGLMIAGLADAGRILQRDDYTVAATGAAEFVLKHLRDQNGRLKRTHAGGESKLNAYIDDYAFFTSGLIALHRATGDDRWSTLAKEVTDAQVEWFWDDQRGGFYFTSKDHPSLIVRSTDPVDGAIPSGISVAAENLFYLARKLDQPKYEQPLKETLQSLVPLFQKSPAASPRAAAVVAAYLDDVLE